jgi:hypothetical protein
VTRAGASAIARSSPGGFRCADVRSPRRRLAAAWPASARLSAWRCSAGRPAARMREPVGPEGLHDAADRLDDGAQLVLLKGAYLGPELRAVGVPMESRGARAEEYLNAIRSLWYDDAPAFHGRYVDFADVDAHPRPLQRPIPIVAGGHSPAALRRAARQADGWYAWMLGCGGREARGPASRPEGKRTGPVRRPGRRADLDLTGRPCKACPAPHSLLLWAPEKTGLCHLTC